MTPPLAVLDLETDPFMPGRKPEPFVAGYYDGSKYVSIWEPEPLACIDRTILMLEKEPASIVYWHNGGRFDSYYFMRYVSGNLKIIGNRIVSCVIGKHEFRDSYAIMPFPLRSYKKDEIDYRIMERGRREKHKDEILKYLQGDCIYLWDLVSTFHSEFGNQMTIGGAAIKTIKKFHKFDSGSPVYDTELRKKFYFGGRNQCFKTGLIYAPINVYDVNSMYMHVMRNMLHPVSTGILLGDRVTDDTCFVVARGRNHGAFPQRNKEGLDFTSTEGIYGVSIHEWTAALDTGTFEPTHILETYRFQTRITFQEFVDYCFDKKLTAKQNDDDARDLLYKYLGNSGYGKFSQNPENFWDYQILPADEIPREKCNHCEGTKHCPNHCHMCWRLNGGMDPYVLDEDDIDAWLCQFCQGSGWKWRFSEGNDEWRIWAARPQKSYFHNVATGASITSGARSVLLRGLALAENLMYCDTDSIIASGHQGLRLSKTELGAWKTEAQGDAIALAGKKLYCVYSLKPHCEHGAPLSVTCKKCPVNRKESEQVTLPDGRRYWVIKKAHKGVRLTGRELLDIAQGDTIEYANPAPSFKRDGRAIFISRKVRRTTK
jgi:hypothetical protein